jgi:hypothetical protein
MLELFTILKTEDGKAEFKVGTYPKKEVLVNCLKDAKLIHRPPIPIFGKMGVQHRNVGFFSDFSKGYSYSKQTMKSQPLTNELKALLEQVNEEFKADYNGILINEYTPGDDYLSAHSDDETTLGNIGVLGIVVNETPRTFRIRAKAPVTVLFDKCLGRELKESFKGDDEIVADFEFEDCAIYLMTGINFQKLFKHEIPLRKKCTTTRWSFTFRKHLV